jgi:hypothetical protein
LTLALHFVLLHFSYFFLLERKKTTDASPFPFGGFLLSCRVRGFFTKLFQGFSAIITRIQKRIYSPRTSFFSISQELDSAAKTKVEISSLRISRLCPQASTKLYFYEFHLMAEITRAKNSSNNFTDQIIAFLEIFTS